MKQLITILLTLSAWHCFSQPFPGSVKSEPTISYNQPIAIRINGGGYVKYSYRDYGISLRWNTFPVYEWVIRNGDRKGPVNFNEPFQLYNTRVKKYMVYAHQNYGINMNWSNQDAEQASREWIFEGDASKKNPQGLITNKAGANDHYLKYGERTWGINIVWSGKPSTQNIEFVTDEIQPSELIREGGTWNFDNFNTDPLTWRTFSDAFDLGVFDEDTYNPLTYVIFAALRGKLGEKGNCFGMCLAEELIAERNTTSLPYYGRVEEPIWSQYQESSTLHSAINYFHWRQLSTEFVAPWVHGLTDSYSTIVSKIQNDLRNNQFGLLSIYKDFWSFEGHVVVPYKVEKITNSNSYKVYIYDPNHPAVTLGDSTRFLTVNGSSMTYENTSYDEMSYVPYQRASGYQNLMNNLFDLGYVILGEGNELEQVSDDSGNTLFTSSSTSTARKRASNHLAYSITPAPGLSGDDNGNIGFESDSTITDKLLKEILERKSQQFGPGAKLYLVHDLNLKNIKITVKSTGNKPIVVEAGNKDESVMISAEKINSVASASMTVSEFKKPSSSIIINTQKDQVKKLTVEKTGKNKMKTGMEITNVEVPATENLVSMSFTNDNVTMKGSQNKELTGNKIQLLRSGEKTNATFKVKVQ